ETVGAVAESECHVGDTCRLSARASGNAAATASAERQAPVRAISPACNGIMPWIPAPTALRIFWARGSRTASYWALPVVTAEVARRADASGPPRPAAPAPARPGAVAAARTPGPGLSSP